jgi:hypothetical protein
LFYSLKIYTKTIIRLRLSDYGDYGEIHLDFVSAYGRQNRSVKITHWSNPYRVSIYKTRGRSNQQLLSYSYHKEGDHYNYMCANSLPIIIVSFGRFESF